ncbi:hypothetical protein, partial [Xanthomonas translucens]|uniref:hypothetical protein n=1 Tax=Xanthomonas campestris pv. translucens TaxID=343 RepID=UPI001E3C6364
SGHRRHRLPRPRSERGRGMTLHRHALGKGARSRSANGNMRIPMRYQGIARNTNLSPIFLRAHAS